MSEGNKSILLHPYQDSEGFWLSRNPGSMCKLYKVVGGEKRKADFFNIGIMLVVQGECLATHVHDGAEEFIYVIKGSGTLIGENDEPIGLFDEGKLIYVPEGARHGIVNRTTKPLELLIWCSKNGELERASD
jgi:mannose-6-phosphate isomerase-like protein (cupin superfamily)